MGWVAEQEVCLLMETNKNHHQQTSLCVPGMCSLCVNVTLQVWTTLEVEVVEGEEETTWIVSDPLAWVE